MELNKVLGQYELDWACHVATHKEYPYDKLKNKKVYVAGAQDFFSKIKYNTNSVKNVMIVGGGEIGRYLCSILRRLSRLSKVLPNPPEIIAILKPCDTAYAKA